MKNHVISALEQVFHEAQFTTLRFDFRGATTSPHGYSGVSGAVTDALNAIEVLKSRAKISKVGIAGYSFGASVAIRVASLQPPPFLISLSASTNLISEDGFDIEHISSIDCPVLLFHGRSDGMIPPDNLTRLTKILGLKPEDSILLEGEGHFYQRTLPIVVSTISAFVRDLSV